MEWTDSVQLQHLTLQTALSFYSRTLLLILMVSEEQQCCCDVVELLVGILF